MRKTETRIKEQCIREGKGAGNETEESRSKVKSTENGNKDEGVRR